MANVAETAQWEAGIYQFETSDPVEGGPDGIDNRQAKQLANRTAYLKAQQEAHAAAASPHPQYATLVQMQAAIDALVAAAPGALDTLNDLADALGDDPNFATTMTNALALKAALDSPVFVGTPKAPTPSQFDNSAKLATTGALKAAGYQFSTLFNLTGTQALTAAHIGAHVVCTPLAAITLTMPTIASLIALGAGPGAATRIENLSPYPVTITRAGSTDTFNTAGNSLGGIIIQNGDYVDLTLNITGQWIVSGTGNLQYSAAFSAALSSSGYQKLPSGLIIQWINGVSNANGQVVQSWPIAFPNGLLSANSTYVNSGSVLAATVATVSTSSSASTCVVNVCTANNAAVVSANVKVVAIGY